MKNVTKALLASMLLMPAASFAGDISYTYVQAGYTSLTTDASDVDADGFYAGGSFHLAPNVFVFGSYSDTSSEEFQFVAGGANYTVDATTYNAGAGIRAPITDYMDANLAAAWVHAEGDLSGGPLAGSSKDDGFSIALGLRTALGKCLELNTGYNYSDVAEEESSFDVGGVVHVWKSLDATAAYRFGESANAWTAGARFNF